MHDQNQSYEVKNLDTDAKFFITDVDKYCNFDDLDDFDNLGLPFLARALGHRAVADSSGSPFTLYSFSVHARKGDSRHWSFSKRFSDFSSLRSALKGAGYDVERIEEAFPPKRWFGNLEGDVVAFRERALEKCLQLCLNTASPDDCSAVRDFLEQSTCSSADPDRQHTPALPILPITPPFTPPSTSRRVLAASSPDVDFGSVLADFEPRSMNMNDEDMNDEERALSEMLDLSAIEDDGAPTPVRVGLKALLDEGDDGSDFLSIKRSVMEDLLAERKSLYEEMLRYKEESAMLFRDLGTAEEKVEELEDVIADLKGEKLYSL